MPYLEELLLQAFCAHHARHVGDAASQLAALCVAYLVQGQSLKVLRRPETSSGRTSASSRVVESAGGRMVLLIHPKLVRKLVQWSRGDGGSQA